MYIHYLGIRMKKSLLILALLLLASMLTLSSISPAEAIRHAPITVDGDPADWTGTPGAANTWVYNDTAKEWIWTDEVSDDTGWNGNYTYPAATFFTGGDADLTELRVAWNESHVFFLLTFDNITDVGWVDAVGWLSDPVQAETTAVAICIDIDRVNGSGMDLVDDGGDGISADVRLNSTDYWEYLIEICFGDLVLWYYDGEFIGESFRNFPCAANTTVYETIEFVVPISADPFAGLPDPEGGWWMLYVFIGLQDNEHFREVNAVASEWNGGGGSDSPDDPDYYDIAIIPEFPLTFSFALIAAVIFAAFFKLRKKPISIASI